MVTAASVSTTDGGPYWYAIEVSIPVEGGIHLVALEAMRQASANPVASINRPIRITSGEILRARSCCGGPGQIAISARVWIGNSACLMAPAP